MLCPLTHCFVVVNNPLSWKNRIASFQSLANPKSSLKNPCSDIIFYHYAYQTKLSSVFVAKKPDFRIVVCFTKEPNHTY